MKFISDVSLSMETMLGTILNVKITLILLEEAAQVIVCDGTNQLGNMVCAMNMSEDAVTSTKVFEDRNTMQGGAYGGEDEETLVSDKAQKVAERIC